MASLLGSLAVLANLGIFVALIYYVVRVLMLTTQETKKTQLGEDAYLLAVLTVLSSVVGFVTQLLLAHRRK
jgi:uncharacterized membrane protein YhaH (DUF805 family)